MEEIEKVLQEKIFECALVKRAELDEMLYDIAGLCIRFYNDRQLKEVFDKIRKDDADRVEWLYLRQFCNECSDMDEYGAGYLAKECLDQYLAYLACCLELDAADRRDGKFIMIHLKHLGEIMDECIFQKMAAGASDFKIVSEERGMAQFLKILAELIDEIENKDRLMNRLDDFICNAVGKSKTSVKYQE